MPPDVDTKELKKLLAEKLPQREIAQRLNVPRTTLQRMIKGFDAAPAAEDTIPAPSDGVPVVDMGKLTPEEVETVRGDFWEVIAWWRERKRQQVYQSQPRETARQTYHVEKRYINLLKLTDFLRPHGAYGWAGAAGGRLVRMDPIAPLGGARLSPAPMTCPQARSIPPPSVMIAPYDQAPRDDLPSPPAVWSQGLWALLRGSSSDPGRALLG